MTPPLKYIPAVIEAHVDEAGYLAQLYLTAMSDSPLDESYLHNLATRLRGHVKGLLLNPGPVGTILDEREEEGGMLGEPEWVFVSSLMAFNGRKVDQVKRLVDETTELGEFDQGAALRMVAFSLVWLPENTVYPWMQKFGASERAELAYIVLFTNTWRNQSWVEDRSVLMQRMLSKSAPAWMIPLALGLMAQDEATDWVSFLRSEDTAELEERRFRLAAARLAIGDVTALKTLKAFVDAPNDWREEAAVLCFSHLDTSVGKEWLRPLQKEPGRERIMLLAIGAMRERSLLPWVVNQLADPVLARLAGQAIGQILGVDLEEQGWALDDAELDDAWLALEGDEMLPWPNEPVIRQALKLS